MAERGRPVSTDPDEIATIALELFDRHGYSATTMEQVAEAAGVSRSTLFRYFPNKADLLAKTQDAFVAEFLRDLAAQPADTPLIDAAMSANAAGLVRDRRGVKEMIRSVSDPEAFADAWRFYNRWQKIIVEFVASHRGVPADDFDAEVAGAAIWSAIWAANVVWAGSDEPAPHRFMDQARQAIRSVLE